MLLMTVTEGGEKVKTTVLSLQFSTFMYSSHFKTLRVKITQKEKDKQLSKSRPYAMKLETAK